MRFKKNSSKIIATVAADILLFAILALAFFGYNMKPIDVDPNASVSLSTPPPAPSYTEAPSPAPTETDYPSAAPTPQAEPTPEPVPLGLLGDKFAEKFTDGEIIIDENSYRSDDICIEITPYSQWINGYLVAYYVADIYIQDIECLRTANAQSNDNTERLEAIAEREGAIFAASGDFWMGKRTGLVIRNGELFRDELNPNQDVCVLNYDGTMNLYYAGQVLLDDEFFAQYPLHAWSFGPILLDGSGQPRTEGFNCDGYVADRHPRCAIGYYEPGHYCLVVVDGRTKNYSYGVTMAELSLLMYDLGCYKAYNLDGGLTAMMWFNGALVSKPCEGGRENTDIVYIREPNK